MPYNIGIDIGGRTAKLGIIDIGRAEICGTATVETGFDAPPNKVVRTIAETTASLIRSVKNCAGKFINIGIGCPGSVDTNGETATYLPNLNWKNVSVAALLKQYLSDFELGCEPTVRLFGDAYAATYAEHEVGAGRGHDNIVMLTLGTGVGGGVVVGGRMYLGSAAPELGHMIIRSGGRRCGCGMRGCLEAYASAAALERAARSAAKRHPESVLSGGDTDCESVFAAAKGGDKTAAALVDDYIENLSIGILNICNTFRPSAIILGGGLSAQGESLAKGAREYCEARHYGYRGAPKPDIKIAQLGNTAGMLGAALLMRDVVKNCTQRDGKLAPTNHV